MSEGRFRRKGAFIRRQTVRFKREQKTDASKREASVSYFFAYCAPTARLREQTYAASTAAATMLIASPSPRLRVR